MPFPRPREWSCQKPTARPWSPSAKGFQRDSCQALARAPATRGRSQPAAVNLTSAVHAVERRRGEGLSFSASSKATGQEGGGRGGTPGARATPTQVRSSSMDVIIPRMRAMCTRVRYRTRARAKDISCVRMTRERKISYAEIPIHAGVRYHTRTGERYPTQGPPCRGRDPSAWREGRSRRSRIPAAEPSPSSAQQGIGHPPRSPGRRPAPPPGSDGRRAPSMAHPSPLTPSR